MARRIREVLAAAKAKATIGSSQSASDGTAILPSGAYGYGESGRSTMTTCSPDQRVENPAASGVGPRADAEGVKPDTHTGGHWPIPKPITGGPAPLSVRKRASRPAPWWQ